MNKVPQEVRLVVSRKDKGGDWELDRLLAVMHQELDARKRAACAGKLQSTTRPAILKEQTALERPTLCLITIL